MRKLAELRDGDIGFEDRKVDKWGLREASRCILSRGNKIAMLNVEKFSYYKLPGGGIEKGESREEALKREVKEETGSRIRIEAPLGKIISYKSHEPEKQISYCYLASEIEQGKPEYTQKEKDEKFRPECMELTEAIAKVKNQDPDHYIASFITSRDLRFLKEARERM